MRSLAQDLSRSAQPLDPLARARETWLAAGLPVEYAQVGYLIHPALAWGAWVTPRRDGTRQDSRKQESAPRRGHLALGVPDRYLRSDPREAMSSLIDMLEAPDCRTKNISRPAVATIAEPVSPGAHRGVCGLALELALFLLKKDCPTAMAAVAMADQDGAVIQDLTMAFARGWMGEHNGPDTVLSIWDLSTITWHWGFTRPCAPSDAGMLGGEMSDLIPAGGQRTVTTYCKLPWLKGVEYAGIFYPAGDDNRPRRIIMSRDATIRVHWEPAFAAWAWSLGQLLRRRAVVNTIMPQLRACQSFFDFRIALWDALQSQRTPDETHRSFTVQALHESGFTDPAMRADSQARVAAADFRTLSEAIVGAGKGRVSHVLSSRRTRRPLTGKPDVLASRAPVVIAPGLFDTAGEVLGQSDFATPQDYGPPWNSGSTSQDEARNSGSTPQDEARNSGLTHLKTADSPPRNSGSTSQDEARNSGLTPILILENSGTLKPYQYISITNTNSKKSIPYQEGKGQGLFEPLGRIPTPPPPPENSSQEGGETGTPLRSQGYPSGPKPLPDSDDEESPLALTTLRSSGNDQEPVWRAKQKQIRSLVSPEGKNPQALQALLRSSEDTDDAMTVALLRSSGSTTANPTCSLESPWSPLAIRLIVGAIVAKDARNHAEAGRTSASIRVALGSATTGWGWLRNIDPLQNLLVRLDRNQAGEWAQVGAPLRFDPEAWRLWQVWRQRLASGDPAARALQALVDHVATHHGPAELPDNPAERVEAVLRPWGVPGLASPSVAGSAAPGATQATQRTLPAVLDRDGSEDPEAQAIWECLLGDLREVLSESAFTGWFEPCRPTHMDRTGRHPVLYVRAPLWSTKVWIEQQMAEDLHDALGRIGRQDLHIVFTAPPPVRG